MTDVILFICWGLILPFCIWGMICNRWTGRDRLRAIDSWRKYQSGTKFWALAGEFDKVNYDQHMWAYIFFRDPWSLYDPSVRKAVGK